MNFNYIKGSKEDFKDAPDDRALVLIQNRYTRNKYFAVKFERNAPWHNYAGWSDDNKQQGLYGLYQDSIVIAERVAIPEEKSKEFEWDGRDLPPVGLKCQVKWTSDTDPKWYDFIIKYKGVRHLIADVSGKEYTYEIEHLQDDFDTLFRKIPLTEEQLRANAIEEINALVGDIEAYPTWRDAIAAIYDSGYRKQS